MEFPSGAVEDGDLIKAIEKAGYKAEIEVERDGDREKELREKEIRSLKRSFIIPPSLVYLFSAMFSTWPG